MIYVAAAIFVISFISMLLRYSNKVAISNTAKHKTIVDAVEKKLGIKHNNMGRNLRKKIRLRSNRKIKNCR